MQNFPNTNNMKCIICNNHFDPADLSQVAEHMHANISAPSIIGKKGIRHAREVYPYCTGEFAVGVHIYLKGEPVPARPCADELIQGFYAAERDLKEGFYFIN